MVGKNFGYRMLFKFVGFEVVGFSIKGRVYEIRF